MAQTISTFGIRIKLDGADEARGKFGDLGRAASAAPRAKLPASATRTNPAMPYVVTANCIVCKDPEEGADAPAPGAVSPPAAEAAPRLPEHLRRANATSEPAQKTAGAGLPAPDQTNG